MDVRPDQAPVTQSGQAQELLLDHNIGNPEHARGNSEAERLRDFEVMTSSNLAGRRTGRSADPA
jgi:hypothetical protein